MHILDDISSRYCAAGAHVPKSYYTKYCTKEPWSFNFY